MPGLTLPSTGLYSTIFPDIREGAIRQRCYCNGMAIVLLRPGAIEAANAIVRRVWAAHKGRVGEGHCMEHASSVTRELTEPTPKAMVTGCSSTETNVGEGGLRFQFLRRDTAVQSATLE